MPTQIHALRADTTQLPVQAIVNAANASLLTQGEPCTSGCCRNQRRSKSVQCRANTLVRPSRPTSMVLNASRRMSLGCPEVLSRMVQAVSQIGL